MPEEEAPPTVTIEWRGHTLTLPATLDDCDVSVLEAFEDGKTLRAARGILGAQYDKLKPLTVRDVGDLTDDIAKAMGLGAGE